MIYTIEHDVYREGDFLLTLPLRGVKPVVRGMSSTVNLRREFIDLLRYGRADYFGLCREVPVDIQMDIVDDMVEMAVKPVRSGNGIAEQSKAIVADLESKVRNTLTP